MLLILIGQCKTKHIERNLSFDGFWICSVIPDHWRILHTRQPTVNYNTSADNSQR